MSFLIAVDDSLHNITGELQKKGYQIVGLSYADFRDVDAYIIDKSNQDLMRIKNTIGDEPVIAAADNDAATVINTLRDKLKVYEKELNEP